MKKSGIKISMFLGIIILCLFLFVACGTKEDGHSDGEEEYVAKKYNVSVTVEGEGKVEGAGEYEDGDDIGLYATAEAGSLFYKWSDGETHNIRSVIVDQDISLTAHFKKGVEESGYRAFGENTIITKTAKNDPKLIAGIKYEENTYLISGDWYKLDANFVRSKDPVSDYSYCYPEGRGDYEFLSKDTQDITLLLFNKYNATKFRVGSLDVISQEADKIYPIKQNSKKVGTYGDYNLYEYTIDIPAKDNNEAPGTMVVYGKYYTSNEIEYRWEMGFDVNFGSKTQYTKDLYYAVGNSLLHIMVTYY